MRRTVLGLSGGALPVAAGISVFTVLAGTLAVVDWAVVSPAAPRGDLHLAPLPRTAPLARSALDGPVRAMERSGRRAAATDEQEASARRIRVAAARPARALLLSGPGPHRPAPVVITPPASRPAPSAGPAAPAPAAPAPAAPEPRAAAPLAGVGTVAAVAAENTTEALGTVVGDVAEGAARALPVLRQPLVRVGTLVQGTLTGAGRLVGGLVRGLTGAPPRVPNTAAHPQPAP